MTEEEAVVALRRAGCVFAEEEAGHLAEHARDAGHALAGLVARRAAGEPLEQVLGYADFAGVRVRLRAGVFVPRVRSELLVRVAVERLGAADGRWAGAGRRRAADRTLEAGGEGVGPLLVDMCCGSGALGLAVRTRRPDVTLYAADSDPIAVACARDNLGPARVLHGDLFAALPAHLAGTVDLLLANVPYVATGHLHLLPSEARDHEPRTALDGGPDGLDVFRAVVTDAPRWLAPGGTLLTEITEAQIPAATAAVAAAGLEPRVVRDEDLEATVVCGMR